LTQLADQFAEVSVAHLRSVQESVDRSAARLSAVLDALERMHAETAKDRVISAAPQRLCASGAFDRVMFSWVRGSMWLPQVFYVRNRDGQVIREIDGVAEKLEIPLASPLVEAEVVRRRLPALVNDAPHEPRAHSPLMRRTDIQDYVVAPLVAMSTVVGLLHADRVPGAQPVTAVDRDLLRMFADGVGVVYERVVLAERAEQQRSSVAEVCDAAVRALVQFDETPVLARHSPPPPMPSRPALAPGWDHNQVGESTRLSRLTVREREVLGLLASGATNSQLADRLTVAESTVKSHVKHILHKLGAGNRAAAIACYLRETRPDERRPR
jgi:DNA-binding CsgD family transcriptional regulator/GAF domain-containing protein